MTDRFRLVQAHETARRFYRRELLRHRRGWPARFLAERKLGHLLKPTSSWDVGYAPASWTELVTTLKREGFAQQEILDSGLGQLARTGRLIDRFRDRLMFAVHDSNLEPVGFIGRSRRDDTVKYLNSPKTAIFHKSEVLVGVAEQLDSLAAGAVPVVVEGPTDAVAIDAASSAAGRRWAAGAICGKVLSPAQARLLRTVSTSDSVIVALDADARSSMANCLDPLSAAFDRVLAVELPGDHDLSSLYADRGGPQRLVGLLSRPRLLLDVAIETELERWTKVLDHISGRVNALRAVAPLVVRLPNERLAREVEQLARALDLDPRVVSLELIDRASRPHDPSPSAPPEIDLGLPPLEP